MQSQRKRIHTGEGNKAPSHRCLVFPCTIVHSRHKAQRAFANKHALQKIRILNQIIISLIKDVKY